jgi:urease accessory protein
VKTLFSPVGVAAPKRPGNALTGRLELSVSRLESGRTSVTHQYHAVPFHLSKTYWDGQVLMAQIINPTAGIFEGDEMECLVDVGAGASLIVTSPSAVRVHTMLDGGGAFLRQHFRVAKGGWLEVSPELFIPQRASSYRQKTEIEVDPDASLYFVETLAPGRVAHGESFAFEHLDWSFSLRIADRLVALERAKISPPDHCWMLEVKGWEKAYYGSVWMTGPTLTGLPETLQEEIEALHDPESCLVGISKVSPQCYSIKVMARGSIFLRRSLAAIRGIMRTPLPLLASNLRKL